MATHAPAYLAVSRHGLYYFRITIPQALRALLGARELKRSLKTTHRPTAIRLARAYALHCEALFASFQEPTVNYRQMRQVLEQVRDEMLAYLQRGLEENGPLPFTRRRELEAHTGVLRTVTQIDRYNHYTVGFADRALAKVPLAEPLSPEARERFYLETAKMLSAVWETHLAQSAAMNSYLPPTRPAPEALEAVPPALSAPLTPTAVRVGVREVIEAY